MPLTRGDADARVQRLRRAGVDDGEVDLTRRLEVGEIRRRRAVRRNLHGPRLALRIPFARRVDLVIAGGQRHFVTTVVTDAPRIRRATFRDETTGSCTGLPSRVLTEPRKVPAGKWPRSISAATTGLRSPRAPTCSHASNVRDSPGCNVCCRNRSFEREPTKCHVRRVERDAPVFVVGDSAVGQRSRRRAFL